MCVVLSLGILVECVKVTDHLPEWQEFDYIVVGGGSAGCVVARELSDNGFETLLIERGDLPVKRGTSTLYDLREALTDPKLSQPVVTTSGVRTAVANVLGGGSSVNLGIWIEENQEYYDALMEYFSTVSDPADWQRWKDLLSGRQQAAHWVREKVTQDFESQQASAASSLNGEAAFEVNAKQKSYANVMEAIVNDWFGGYVGLQPEIQPGRSWTPYSLFSQSKNQTRGGDRRRFSMAEAVLRANDRLTVLLNATVDKIMPMRPNVQMYQQLGQTVPREHEVHCVQYGATQAHEPTIVGNVDPTIVAADSPQFDQLQRSALHISSLKTTQRYSVSTPMRAATAPAMRRVCLKGTQKALNADVLGLQELQGRSRPELGHQGEIILSTGSVMSPWLLFKSGIGPKDYTNRLGVWNYAEHAWIGQNLQDRPVVGVSLELKDQTMDLRDSETLISHHASLGLKQQMQNSSGRDYGDSYYANYFSPAALFHRRAMGFEDLFGGDAVEGVVWQSRMLFPPEMRNLPTADLMSEISITCGSERRRAQRKADGMRMNLLPYCRIVDAIESCVANSAVWFTFLTHVKSRGSVSVGPDGQLMVDPGYLSDEADRREMVDNVKSLFRMLLQYSGILSSVFQSVSDTQCPAHTFADEFDTLDSLNNIFLSALLRRPRDITRNEHLPFATEPQDVPNVDDDASIWRYVQSHVMSMWHLVGSNSLGVVLDDEFHIHGVRRLSVIDASALPIQTRMNPASTLMVMAKLAVDHKLRLRTEE